VIDKDEILDVCANEVEPLETAPAAVFMAWIDQITKYGWFVRNYNDKEVHLRHPQRPSGICLQLHGAGVQAEHIAHPDDDKRDYNLFRTINLNEFIRHIAYTKIEPEPVVSVPKTRTPVHIEPKRRRPIRSGDDVRYR
jgi:hypothetical protein